MILGDGTVVPSFLATRSEAGLSGFAAAQSEYATRVGRVVASYPPTHASNTNGKFWEFDVKVDLVANGTYSEIIYPRAQIASMFGGIADFSRWTPRIGGIIQESGHSVYSGTRVILLCLNGSTKNAVIIGGQNHPGRPQDPLEDGLHSLSEYNGIRFEINKDGDYTIRHRGATDDAGKVIKDDKSTNGSFISLDKLGDITLATAPISEFIRLDSQGKRVVITSTDHNVEINAKDNVKLISAGVLTGDATDYTMMGSTYRDAQASLHNTLKTKLIALHGAMQTAGTGLTSAASSHAIAVTGPIIGAPALASAGAALIQAANLVTEMMNAISRFEDGAESYLSNKNLSD